MLDLDILTRKQIDQAFAGLGIPRNPYRTPAELQGNVTAPAQALYLAKEAFFPRDATTGRLQPTRAQQDEINELEKHYKTLVQAHNECQPAEIFGRQIRIRRGGDPLQRKYYEFVKRGIVAGFGVAATCICASKLNLDPFGDLFNWTATGLYGTLWCLSPRETWNATKNFAHHRGGQVALTGLAILAVATDFGRAEWVNRLGIPTSFPAYLSGLLVAGCFGAAWLMNHHVRGSTPVRAAGTYTGVVTALAMGVALLAGANYLTKHYAGIDTRGGIPALWDRGTREVGSLMNGCSAPLSKEQKGCTMVMEKVNGVPNQFTPEKTGGPYNLQNGTEVEIDSVGPQQLQVTLISDPEKPKGFMDRKQTEQVLRTQAAHPR